MDLYDKLRWEALLNELKGKLKEQNMFLEARVFLLTRSRKCRARCGIFHRLGDVSFTEDRLYSVTPCNHAGTDMPSLIVYLKRMPSSS